MEKLDIDFKKLALRVKVKRWSLMILISITITILILIIGYRGTHLFVRKNYLALDKEFQVLDVINSPNIYSDSRYIASNDAFGGVLVSDRYKNIDGYKVAWEQRQGTFNWMAATPDAGNDAFAEIQRGEQIVGMENKDLRMKVPTFFNSAIKKSAIQKTDELKTLSKMDNQLAEVGITFDKPYSYEEIQQMIPSDLLINWYWIGTSGSFDTTELSSYLGINANEMDGTLNETDFKDFVKVLKKTNVSSRKIYSRKNQSYSLYADGASYAKVNNNLAESKFSGIIVSGKTENFKALENQNWLFASSVGVTVERVPYIEPIK